jgi:basic membrane protein A
VEKLSKEYPEVTFFHCSGYKQTENMSNYFGRMYQPRYLSGIIAGMKTETNKIGYVAAFPIPEVIRGINAFTLGVQSVNPDAEVEVVWTSTWYNPATEKEAAVSLLDAGADVITQHQDTVGPQQAAEERGAYSIGYNTDMRDMAPKAYMTAPVWNWGPYYIEQVKNVY